MPPEHDNPLEAARDLARAHRLFIADVHEQLHGHWVPAWVVYRRMAGGRMTRIGRRSNPAELLRFVRQLIGESAHA